MRNGEKVSVSCIPLRSLRAYQGQEHWHLGQRRICFSLVVSVSIKNLAEQEETPVVKSCTSSTIYYDINLATNLVCCFGIYPQILLSNVSNYWNQLALHESFIWAPMHLLQKLEQIRADDLKRYKNNNIYINIVLYIYNIFLKHKRYKIYKKRKKKGN